MKRARKADWLKGAVPRAPRDPAKVRGLVAKAEAALAAAGATTTHEPPGPEPLFASLKARAPKKSGNGS